MLFIAEVLYLTFFGNRATMKENFSCINSGIYNKSEYRFIVVLNIHNMKQNLEGSYMKKLIELFKKENGQSLVLAALLMVILMGFDALVIDVGMISLTRSELQRAADAAALAGAQDLPDINTSKNTAYYYTEQNKVLKAETTPTVPYKNSSYLIEVFCKRTINNTFARVIGFDQTKIKARAVAKNWNGSALPFINLDDKYGEEGTILEGWEKVDPGDKERINNKDLDISPDNTSIDVDYEDGSIMYQKGKNSSINAALENLLTVGNTVYLFSLSNDVIDSKVYQKKHPQELHEGDEIPICDVVLLECQVVAYNDKSGKRVLTLEFVKLYNISSNETPPTRLIE